MSKTASGFMLIAGLAVFFIGGAIGSQAGIVDTSPDNDWVVRVYQISGLSIGLVGIGLFFWGCRCFARG